MAAPRPWVLCTLLQCLHNVQLSAISYPCQPGHSDSVESLSILELASPGEVLCTPRAWCCQELVYPQGYGSLLRTYLCSSPWRKRFATACVAQQVGNLYLIQDLPLVYLDYSRG